MRVVSLEAFEDLECLFALLDMTYNSAVLNLNFKNSSPNLKHLLLDKIVYIMYCIHAHSSPPIPQHKAP